jgi:hypothetical protein
MFIIASRIMACRASTNVGPLGSGRRGRRFKSGHPTPATPTK